MDLNFQVAARPNDELLASYSCPCGCKPRLVYPKGSEALTDDCCCGNVFAIGPEASAALPSTTGRHHTETVVTPWGDQLEAAWKLVIVGAEQEHPHDPGHGHDHEHGDGHDQPATSETALDPVCGMTVDIASATAKGLQLEHDGTTYYFCGRGCKLEFGDDPARFLDPSHVPSM